ncbi:hypothetical protein CR970_04150 [Candidatus Saccharibacteria bacterium]|nr:MAG: hypothetical protein CR970_04150 [Candidatus Saccharibacteria bacterium]
MVSPFEAPHPGSPDLVMPAEESTNSWLRRRGATALVAATLALGGCSTEASSDGAPDPSNTAASTETAELPQHTVEHLLQDQADIQLLYVPVAKSQENTVPSHNSPKENPSVAAIRNAIISQDESFLEAEQNYISDVTYGRYRPDKIRVSMAPEVSLADDCMDLSIQKKKQINDTVKPLIDDQVIPVAVVDAPSCLDSIGRPTFGGFAGNGQSADSQIPVATTDSFAPDEFSFYRTVMHEIGHYVGGLGHAGRIQCEYTDRGSHCAVDPTGDSRSLMSYEPNATLYQKEDTSRNQRFTTPELDMLNLLEDNEKVTIDPSKVQQEQSIELGTLGLAGTKLLVVDGGEDDSEDRYISWGYDPFAIYTQQCVEDKDLPPEVTEDDIVSAGAIMDEKRKTAINYTCFVDGYNPSPLNELSVQTRRWANERDGVREYDADGRSLLLMGVPQTQNNINGLHLPEYLKGVTKPGAIAYRNDDITIGLDSYTPHSVVLTISPNN